MLFECQCKYVNALKLVISGGITVNELCSNEMCFVSFVEVDVSFVFMLFSVCIVNKSAGISVILLLPMSELVVNSVECVCFI